MYKQDFRNNSAEALLENKKFKLEESLPKVNIVTPVFAGYRMAKVTPIA